MVEIGDTVTFSGSYVEYIRGARHGYTVAAISRDGQTLYLRDRHGPLTAGVHEVEVVKEKENIFLEEENVEKRMD